jgi:hypothetical protein
MFLMPGLVAPELPAGFAVPTAYGDLTAVILALLALASLRYDAAFAVPMLWLFNIVGLLDLIYANIATFKEHVDPVQLGTSYYLAVINVPALVVVHILIFLSAPRASQTCADIQDRRQAMNRTRRSLYYLAAYLLVGGLAFLIIPAETLKFLWSHGDYGNIFPQLVGMFASGFG